MDKSFFDAAAAALGKECFRTPPDLAVILGSGWGDVIAADRTVAEIPYSELPGIGGTTVCGHAGKFLLYERAGRRVAAFCGRRHWYEGCGWESVVAPVELARRMGCRRMLLTNASGGINPALRPGDFVIIADHVNTLGANPLVGPRDPDWGPRFPDMTEIYTRSLRELLHATAKRLGFRAMHGVYAFSPGPVYETPAEVRAYAHLGADIVGMSTAPEAVFACACGMEVAGLSFVANLAAGITPHPLRHEEVIAAADAAKKSMALLIDGFTAAMERP